MFGYFLDAGIARVKGSSIECRCLRVVVSHIEPAVVDLAISLALGVGFTR